MNIIINTLNSILNLIFGFANDWGIAVVLLTMLVRVILLPVSLKQRASMYKQQALAKKMEEMKEKYRYDKKKLETEMQKYYSESSKSMLGCFVSLLQLPVVMSLYSVIIRMPAEAGTAIIPWLSSIRVPDSTFIIPLVYALTSISPSLVSYISYLKIAGQAEVSRANLVFTSVLSVLITFKTPAAIGVYLITTSIFSLLEEIGYRFYIKYRCLD